jgi:hypothetical protein
MKKIVMGFITVLLLNQFMFAAIPKQIRSRFVIGDPQWKELTLKPDLAKDYDKAWGKLVEIIVDNGYDIGFMEKDSGYIRTNANTGIVVLKKYWSYQVKLVAKIVVDPENKNDNGKPLIKKLRIQVKGYLTKSKKGYIVQSYRGYDKIVLDDIFNDLRLVFGEK